MRFLNNLKTLATQGLEPNGGGALGSKVSKLGSKGVRRNFTLALLGRGQGEGLANQIAESPQEDSFCTKSIDFGKSRQVCDDRCLYNFAKPCHRALIARSIAKSIQVTDKKLDCHVADAPRNDNKSKSSPLAGEKAVVCEAKRALQMQERGASSCNNKTLTRISKFTTFTKKFYPLPEVEGKCAFTLAEVLITLGIIGVVAAITLPSVINDFRQKQLHTAFLRSSSMIQNALNQTANEYGYTNYKELNSICGKLGKNDAFSACRQENQVLFEEICSDFLSRFKILKSMKATQFWYLGNNTTNFLEQQNLIMAICME